VKIRTKILLIALSFVLVTGAVSTVVSQLAAKKIVSKQIVGKLETAAESRTDYIQAFLETQKQAIKQLSESIVIEEFLLASEDDHDFVQKFDDVLWRLKSATESAEHDHEISVLDESGIIVASSDKQDIGKDRSEDPYFGGAKEAAFIKDAYVSQRGKRNSLAFSAPVFDEEDPALLGVVVIRFPTEELNRITMERTGLGETGEIYLVNKEGYMITPSRFAEDTFLKLRVDTEIARKCFEDVERFGAQAHQHEVIPYKNYLGREVLGIHQHIPEMSWCLVAEMSKEEAFAPVATLSRVMLSVLGVLSVLAIIISILISQTVTKPISKLHRGTDEVVNGNLDYRVGTETKDEIGQLSRAFDSMTGKLKESETEVQKYQRMLEERIEARTNELAQANEGSTKELAQANEGLRQEVEERRQVEQRLRIFSHSIGSSVDGVVIGDPGGNITYANEALVRMFGYSKEELIGTEIPFLYAENQLHKLKEALKATGGGGWTGELIGRRRGGGLFPVEMSSSTIVDDEGRIIAQVVNHRDITERKRAEETLREAERSRVAEALREAEKLAVVGEMAGPVAHEVLNPIAVLLSRTRAEMEYLSVSQSASNAMSEIIAEWQENLKVGKLSEYLHQEDKEGGGITYAEEDLGVLSSALQKNLEGLNRSQEFLSFFERQIEGVVEIIDRLRQMPRARTQAQELDINGCLKGVADLFRDGLKKRNIRLTQKLTAKLSKVRVDHTALFQVFSTLLRSAVLAIEAKGEGDGEVTFSSEVTGGEIRVRVIDNGVGIPEEKKNLVFESDFSGESRVKGMGLDLVRSRRLVREAGGELVLESSSWDGGSIFLVRLPLTKGLKGAELGAEKAAPV